MTITIPISIHTRKLNLIFLLYWNIDTDLLLPVYKSKKQSICKLPSSSSPIKDPRPLLLPALKPIPMPLPPWIWLHSTAALSRSIFPRLLTPHPISPPPLLQTGKKSALSCMVPSIVPVPWAKMHLITSRASTRTRIRILCKTPRCISSTRH